MTGAVSLRLRRLSLGPASAEHPGGPGEAAE